MKIGIFGGSFNPPHNMHIDIAKQLLNKQYVDKLFFVPTGSKYKYKNNLAPDNNRLDMLNIIAAQNEGMEVSDFELKDYVVYTCDTLAHFHELFPNDEIYFICGTDNLSYIDKWKTGLDLLKNNKFLIIDREGNEVNALLEKYKDYKENIIVSDIPLNNISSTIIRNLIEENKREELSNYLDPAIIDYIYKNNLYI